MTAITYAALAALIAALAAYIVFRQLVVPNVFPRLCLAGHGVCATITYRSLDNAALATVKEQNMLVFFNGQRAFMYPEPAMTNPDICEKDEVLAYAVNRVTGELMFHQCAPPAEKVEERFAGEPERTIVYQLERRKDSLGYLNAGEVVDVLEMYGVLNRSDAV